MPVDAIRFYKAEGVNGRPLPYGYLSNFSNHGFTHFGVTYKTAEHFYQASKYLPGTKVWESIIEAATPSEAYRLGKNPLNKINGLLLDNWELLKLDVMFNAVWLKFTNNKDIKEDLIATEDIRLIETSPSDYYWGIGALGTGLNMLGETLMRVRTRLQTKDSIDSILK